MPAGPAQNLSSFQSIMPRPNLAAVPSSTLVLDQQEGMCFQLFRDKLAERIAGATGVTFFSQLVLRECHSSPVVRDLTVALSAFNRAHRSTGPQRESSLEFGISHQTRALRTLRDTLSQGTNHIRLAVTASVLLACNECLQGNYSNSKQQLSSGMELLRTWKAMRANGNKDDAVPSMIDDDFPQVFPKLQFVLMNYYTLEGLSDTYSVRPVSLESIPNRFTNVVDAIMAAQPILETSYHFLGKLEKLKRDNWPPQFPDYIRNYSKFLLQNSDKWTAAMEPLLAVPWIEGHPTILAFRFGLGICRMFQITGFEAEETVYDEHTDEFRRLVRLARRALDSLAVFDKDAPKRLNLIHISLPLSYMACRCRDPVVRRAVLAVLEDCRDRGEVWSIDNAIQGLRYTMELEESCADRNGYIPEAKRVRSHTANWMMHRDGFHVEVMQGPAHGEWVCQKAVLNDPEYMPPF